MAHQSNSLVEHRHRNMFPSALEEAAVVETGSLRCFPRVRGRETRPSLQLNLLKHQIHEDKWVQHIGARCEWLDSSGVQLDAVQDGVI
jgi:hypothetical protein